MAEFRGGRRWLPRLVLSVVLVSILASGLIVYLATRDTDERTDCTDFGIAPGDALSSVDPVMIPAADVENGEGWARGGSPWDNGEVSAAEGVQLGRHFDSGSVRGRYHLFTRGVDFTRPVGMMVRLHGDGGDEYRNPDGEMACMAAVAAAHNMITLVPRTPDRSTMTWWRDLTPNTEWVTKLAARVAADNGVAEDSTWWVGYSGGAEMISYGLIPKRPEALSVGAVMFGGGGAPKDVELTVPDRIRTTARLHWITGELDDGTGTEDGFNAIRAAREGSQWYRERGFTGVETNFPPDRNHFDLPQVGMMNDILNAG
ncbi:hypothetical protein [Corynebacterium pacaense]|uniref:hypothetical protein n=1 Tax=Corynebacterium pacaense TaxID=1816684 RepID=UPI001177A3BA|nr:hypothetical protein [Corynebacterium pacaense]